MIGKKFIRKFNILKRFTRLKFLRFINNIKNQFFIAVYKTTYFYF